MNYRGSISFFLQKSKKPSHFDSTFFVYIIFNVYMNYTRLRSVNIIPNAMKNAAAMSINVSGPVLVFVT